MSEKMLRLLRYVNSIGKPVSITDLPLFSHERTVRTLTERGFLKTSIEITPLGRERLG